MSASKRLKPSIFRPSLIELEDRSVPAGNVTATVTDGMLFIRGDDQANQIQINRAGIGSVTIHSIGQGLTTVNGSTSSVSIGDISVGYDIRMGGGDDEVVIKNVDRSALLIDGDGGNDTITVSSARIRGFTGLMGGDGDDIINVIGSRFDNRTELFGGQGDDRVTVDNTWYSPNSIVDGGAGNNILSQFGAMTPPYRSTPNFTSAFTSSLPTAVNDVATAARGNSVNIAVTANDSAGTGNLNLGSIVITSRSALGTATANSDGTVTYTSDPALGFGADSFKYRISNDAGAGSNEATVNVTVLGTTLVGTTPTVPTVPVVPPPPPGPAADTTAPTVAVTSASASPTANATVQFVVTFSEDVTGFTQSDLAVTNGTISGFGTVSASTYRFNVTRTNQGPITVTVPANAATDIAGNSNTASTQLQIISTEMPDRNNPNVTFQPNGLGSLTVTQGTGAAMEADSNFTTFYTGWLASTGEVFETHNASDTQNFTLNTLIQGWQQGLVGLQEGGQRQLFIPAALAYGAAGSPPTIPANADLVFDIHVLSIRPKTTITTSTLVAPAVTANATNTFTATFSSAVSGFTSSDIAVTNGTISNFQGAAPGSVFIFDVTRTAEGPVSVSIAAGVSQSAGGAQNLAAATVNIISSNIPDRNNPNVAFQSNGLGVNTITQGTGATLQANSNFTTYYTGWIASTGAVFETHDVNDQLTFTLNTLIQGWQQGLVGLQEGGERQLFIPAALAYGAAGSPPNIPANADLVFNIHVVSIRPTTTITTTAPVAPAITANATNSFTATFSAPITGFTLSDITVSNGTASNLQETTPGTVFTFDVTRTAEGPVSVSIAAGVAQTTAGGLNFAASTVTINSSNIPNRNDPGVIYDVNGLGVQTLTQGAGTAVTPSSTITVHYTGWLTNGTIFDSNESPAVPATFPLANLIQGWKTGLLGLQIGGERRLFIPSNQAYGAAGRPMATPPIPPNADLVFDIKLISTT